MTAAEVADKVNQETQEADKKVQKTIENVQNSKLSKFLPTEIKEIQIKDIVKILLLAISVNFMSIYIIFKDPWPKYINFLSWIFNPLVTILFCAQIILGICIYLTCIQGLHIYLTMATILKSALIIVIFSIIQFELAFFKMFLIFVYLLWHTGLDVGFLYYIAILINNENSKKYDEHGVEIKQDNEKV